MNPTLHRLQVAGRRAWRRWSPPVAAALVRARGACARVPARLKATWRRSRTGTLRVTLGTRILLVLVAVAAVSTTFAVLLQDSNLSSDLRRASELHVRRLAAMVAQLLDERLDVQAARYRVLAASPQLLANVEANHPPTLAHFAEHLLPVQGARAILFVDASGAALAGAGDEGLRATMLTAAVAGDGGASARARLLDRDGAVFAVSRTAIGGGEGDTGAGCLLAAEPIDDDELRAWSRLCGARVQISDRAAGAGTAVPVRSVGPLHVTVAKPYEAEVDALQNSRDSLLAGGLLGLSVALAASLLLARHVVRPIRAIQRATERLGAGQLDLRLDQSRNDEVGDVARSFNLMLDSLQRNMRERTCVENQVSHLAYHDSLTGLPNRRMLRQRLGEALSVAKTKQSSLALMFLDLDRFKNVNDTLGHSAGDSLLLAVACRLHDCLQAFTGTAVAKHGNTANAAKDPADAAAAALLARLGGDEFTLMLPDVQNRQQVAQLADRIVAALSTPFEVVGQEVSVSASVGIALAPDDGSDAETLLRDSDMAMFHAKGRGGRGYEFYTDRMEEIAARRLGIENKLRRALENDEFELHYQPKFDLETHAITGFEALLRWRGEDGSFIPPDEFVPIAEETGAIIAIGEWVLRTAIAQNLAWQREGLRPVRIAVNVSARQMEAREDLVGIVRGLLEQSGLDPALLELEITETSLLEAENDAVERLERVRQLGVGLSLDDFGTGYSSLSYLRQLPIDTLKIDRSFIQGADENPADVALVGSIVAMAKVLGLRVVVEGVETRRQRRFLEELGCDEIQGFLISRAVPADAAAELLRKKAKERSAKEAASRSSATASR